MHHSPSPLAPPSPGFTPSAASFEAALATRVADRVLAETSFALRNARTGELRMSSGDLPLDPDIGVASRFNEWFYAGLLVGEGLARLGATLDNSAYQDFGDKQLDFVARHEGWFARQREAFRPAPRAVGRLGHYFVFDQLWASGFAAPWIERRHARPQEPVYRAYTTRFLAFIDASARDARGVLLQEGHVRTDDAYLVAPGLLRHGLGAGDAERVDDAFRQVLGSHAVLFDPARGIHRQSWCASSSTFSGDFWGRGNGWMALAFVDLLACAPTDHPRYAELLERYHATMLGLRRWLAPTGGWRQLLDHDHDWIETSVTGMHTYALARGVNEGWLDSSFAADARLGWSALLAKVQADGSLLDVCPATHQGTREHYLRRLRTPDDQHGYGPFLLAAAESLRLR